jgi:RNA polymerase sigma-70 factor (ECF subfamily)
LNSTAGDILEKFTRPRSGVSAEDNENMAYGQTLSQEGFACLYDNYFPRLYSYVACRIGTQEETEDIVALVFEQILKKFHTYDPRRGNLDTWIFTIARNAIIDRRRYKKRHREQGLDDHLELEADFSLSEYFLKQEEINQLRTYLKRLSEKERELLILRYGAGLPHRRIGEIMNMNEGSVAVSLGRILRKLQKFFEKDAVR